MNRNNFKKQKNLLQDFILRESPKEYSKQTITGLFRSILEPLTEIPNQESLVLLKLNESENMGSVIKRLSFTEAKMFHFSNETEEENPLNIQKNDCWESVEFVLVLASRYSAVLLWDYSLSTNKDFSPICLIYNSKQVGEIARVMFENSKIDLERFLTDYAPDRRENELLNVSINRIADCLNALNEEMVINEAEKEDLFKTEELLKGYEYTSDKAKTISHEIKNHLSVVDLYSKIIENRLKDVEGEKTAKDSIENAVKSIKHATYSITQFLNELKTFAKPILIEKRITPIIEDVVRLITPKAKDENVLVEYVIKNDARVHVDEIKIQSVLINVIYNAIESIKAKGKVIIEAGEIKNNCLRVVVSDTGEGISPEIQNKIFEENFTTKLTGNGLGLHICKSLMKEQYGEIKLLKSDKKGTQMEISIPII